MTEGQLQFGGQTLVGTVTFAQVPVFATTGEVPRLVAEELGYDGAPASLAAQLTVEEDAETGTLRFTTEQEDAEEAVRIADAFADQTVRYLSLRQEELHQARQTSVLEDVQQLEAEIRDLDQQIADQLAAAERRSRAGSSRRRGRLDHPGPPRCGGPRVLDRLRGVPVARRRGRRQPQPDDARAGAAGAGADRRVHAAAHAIDAGPDRRRHRGAPRRRCRPARRAARRQDPRSPQGRGGVRRRRRRRAADADAQAAGCSPRRRTGGAPRRGGGVPVAADVDHLHGRRRATTRRRRPCRRDPRDVAGTGRGQDDHRRQPRRGVRRDRAERGHRQRRLPPSARLEDPHRRAATVAGRPRRHRPARPVASSSSRRRSRVSRCSTSRRSVGRRAISPGRRFVWSPRSPNASTSW